MKPKQNAILLTAGILDQSNAKTAHGLIRTGSRYNIVGVIDENFAGKDAGYLLDKVHRNIKVYGSVNDFIANAGNKTDYAIIGVALPGGKIPVTMIDEIKQAIKGGISIVSGLHDFLSDIPELKALAGQHGVELIDIRKPRPKSELKFWSGEIMNVKSPVIAVLGTDCALGKRTTSCMITEAMIKEGVDAKMIFTGQTGWLQGHEYGFILDSTYNDFISGELENAVVACYNETSPDVIFIEGQSALYNPSGPCGSELLLSAQCKGVILQHAPARQYYNGHEHTGIKISLKKELDTIKLFGSKVIAITLNTKNLTAEEAANYQKEYEALYKIPVILPLEEGMQRLAEEVKKYIRDFDHKTQPVEININENR